MYELFGIVSGLIGVVGYAPYVRDILSRSTQPDRVSWFIWTLEYAALLLALLAKGASSSLWLSGLQFVGVAIVFALSFKFGVGKIDHPKILLLIGICLSLVMWFFTNNATLAILLLLAIEGSGVVLTVMKVYRQPSSETPITWLFISVAGLFGIVAIQPGQANILYVYPIFLVFVGIAVIGASRLGRKRLALD